MGVRDAHTSTKSSCLTHLLAFRRLLRLEPHWLCLPVHPALDPAERGYRYLLYRTLNFFALLRIANVRPVYLDVRRLLRQYLEGEAIPLHVPGSLRRDRYAIWRSFHVLRV